MKEPWAVHHQPLQLSLLTLVWSKASPSTSRSVRSQEECVIIHGNLQGLASSKSIQNLGNNILDLEGPGSNPAPADCSDPSRVEVLDC